jgi:hypothetical protein
VEEIQVEQEVQVASQGSTNSTEAMMRGLSVDDRSFPSAMPPPITRQRSGVLSLSLIFCAVLTYLF